MREIRKFIRQTLNEYITYSDLKDIDRFADSIFSDLGIDAKFTKHFLDRVNDPRNGKDIDPEELKTLYKKAHDKHGEEIAQLKPGTERVFNDKESDINIPVAMNWDGKSKDIDMTAKTVMRKKNFLTGPDSPKIALEDINVPINVGDEILGGKFLNKKVIVKSVGKNKKGDITINDKPLLRFRIKK